MAAHQNRVEIRGDLYKVFIIVPLVILSILLLIGVGIGVWWLVLILAALYIIASLRITPVDEINGIEGLGYPLKIAKAGINIVPAGIATLLKALRAPHQKQFPAEPEMVFQGHDEQDLPVLADGRRQVRPIRIITGRPLPEAPSEAEKMEVEADGPRAGLRKYYDGPLNIQITVKMTGTARYQIIPERFFDFWTQFVGETAEEKFEDIDRQLQDTFVDVCKREWQKRPYGMIIDDDKKIEDLIKEALQKEIADQDWGIRLIEVNLYPPDAGHDLNKEMTRIGEELAKQKQAEAQANANLYTDTKEAEGKLVRENADTDAAHYRAEKLGMSGREVIGLEAAYDMLNNKDKFFFGADGIAQAVASGATILDSLKAGGKSQKDGAPTATPNTGDEK